MAIKRYFVMRHGASEANLAEVVQGVMNVPLATLGKEQASAAGRALVELGITKVYTSPLQRALETALIVAHELKLGVSILDGLRARNLGEWAGRPRQEIKEIWSDMGHPFRNDPDFAPPKGESLKEVDERLFHEVSGLLEKGSQEEVPLLVMHMIGTGALIQREIGGERPRFNNAEVWKIDRDARKAHGIFAPDDKLLLGLE